ncbi:SOS response-associated peptidase family protein, partial [Pelotomaculum sp. PtaB.Bin117]|uniref:SOS response-associated peptidase family protein n=1 Tax=Pelotomaculum sp. PtaB.Bin117 TaxID=1811694 RepID=UPI00257B72CC
GHLGQWSSPEGNDVHSCSIITTRANDFIREIHDRMPVILSKESDYRTWLESDEPSSLKKLLHPYRGPIVSYRVSNLVNSPKFDNPSVIDEIR